MVPLLLGSANLINQSRSIRTSSFAFLDGEMTTNEALGLYNQAFVIPTGRLGAQHLVRLRRRDVTNNLALLPSSLLESNQQSVGNLLSSLLFFNLFFRVRFLFFVLVRKLRNKEKGKQDNK